MDDKYQGKGIGKELLAIQFREYKKAGIKKVELLANSNIGGYAWAKYGFYATNNSLNDVKKSWAWKKKSLWRYEDLTKEDFQLAENVIKKYKKANPTSKTFPRHLIANLHNKKGVHIGKELLLGEEWDADMDLTNRKQMNMLNKYLKNER